MGDKCIYDSAIIENISLNQLGSYGESDYVLNWESSDSIEFEGDLKGSVNMDQSSLKVILDEGQFYFADTLWSFKDSSFFDYFEGKINSQLSLGTVSQDVNFSFVSDNIIDTINLSLNHFELSNFSPWLSKINSSLKGTLNGDIFVLTDS